MSTDKRTIEVILTTKDSGYSAGMDKAARKTKDTSNEVKKLYPLAAAASGKLNSVSMGLTVYGVAAAGAMALATAKTLEFDKTMSRAYAATKGTLDDNTESFQKMRQAAIQAGADTVYSSTEAAGALTELLKAGRTASQALNGELRNSLNLAASDGMELSAATSIMASSMTVFSRNGATAAQVADTLAAGAGLAQGGVSDLGEALKYAGSGAANSNMTIQETVGLLATLANNGMQGSMAGTALTGILRNLKTPTTEGAKALAQLGVSVWDADGKFKGMTPTLVEMAKALDGYSEKDKADILGRIFDVRSLNAALPLLREANTKLADGTSSLENMNKQVSQNGYASEQAATMLDNLAGDVEQFMGSLESAQINSASGFAGLARAGVQSGTAILNSYNALPGAVQTAFAAVSTGLGLVALAGAGLIKAAEYGGKLRDALKAVGVEGGKATKIVKGVGIAGAGITVALAAGLLIWGYFAQKAQESADRVQGIADTLDVVNGSAQNTNATAEKLLNTIMALRTGSGGAPMGDALKDLDTSAAQATQAVMGTDQAWSDFMANLAAQRDASSSNMVQSSITGVMGQLQQQRDEYLKSRVAAEELAKQNNALGTTYTNLGDAQQGASQSYDPLAKGTSNVAKQVSEATDALKAYIAYLYAARDAASGLLGSESSFEAAIDAATAAVDRKTAAQLRGKDINDLNDASVRKANDALRSIADQARNYGAALMEQGYSQEYANAEMDIAAASIMEQATQWGLSREQALAFTNAVTGVPISHITELTVKGARAAEAAVKNFETSIKGLPAEKVTEVSAAIRSGSIKSVMSAIEGLPAEQQINILTILKDAGVKGAKKELDGIASQTAKALNLNVDSKDAKATLKSVREALSKLTDKTITVTINQKTVPAKAGGGSVAVGAISGPGTGTSDSIDAKLSNGEHVWTAAEVNAAGGQEAMYRARALVRAGQLRFRDGGAVGFAKGGAAKKRAAAERAKARKELLDQLRTDLRRGNIQDDVLGGNGLSLIDQLLQWSKDDNLSSKARSGLATAANKYEPRIMALTDQLKQATDKASELQTISDQVSGSLNKFDLASAMETTYTANSDGKGNVWYTQTAATGASIAAAAKARAAKLKTFAAKLSALQKAGASAAVMQDVAALGPDEGIPAVDAFLSDLGSLATTNSAYADIQAYSQAAGQAVTEASYKGGLAAANGLVDGLKTSLSQLGGEMANAFADALGYKVVDGKLQKRAGGGAAYANTPYLVGENEPEVFMTSRNGFILNGAQQQQAFRNAAGMGVVPQALVSAIVSALQSQDRGGVSVGTLVARGPSEERAIETLEAMARRAGK